MAINIQHTYTTHVDIHYYSKDGHTLHCRDYGDLDSIAERICTILVKRNFSYSAVCSEETGELLMTIERS